MSKKAKIKDICNLHKKLGEKRLREIMLDAEYLEIIPSARTEPVAVPHALPEIYYAAGKSYWVEDDNRRWIQVDQGSVVRRLKIAGVSAKVPDKKTASPMDEILCEIQEAQNVFYAGSLAGHDSGIHLISGRQVLVTDSVELIEPQSGDWTTIKTVLENLLIEDGLDQTPYFYGWLKTAATALRARKLRPGQALVLAGERNCGKSFVQTYIITPLLGGREARPYRYMSGRTEFNGELLGAEHLVIEDDAASTDIAARREFGAKLKQFTVNSFQSAHAKNCPAITLNPFWRVSITVNDEPEHLRVLPPMEETIEDKIIILKAHKKPMPMATRTIEDREIFLAKITEELPAFMDYLVNEYEIPHEYVCDRFGVTHFHHPEILEALNEQSPEETLLELINRALFENESGDWLGSAMSLEECLSENQNTKEAARRLLRGTNTCGIYLARLEKKYPERIESSRTATSRKWIIRDYKEPSSNPHIIRPTRRCP